MYLGGYLGGITFQSTLSVRRATRHVRHFDGREDISIHALRKESDRISTDPLRSVWPFQSTLSVRRATPSGG